MKKSTVLPFLGAVVIIGLLILNIWLTLRLREEADTSVKQAIETYRFEDRQATVDQIASAISQVSAIKGPQGDDGATGSKGENGADGAKGEVGKPGKDGKDGKSARQVVIDTDPATGDIIWKYADDTLWTLLVEKCELKGTCQ